MNNFPRLVILMSGKRKSGKDFIAEKLKEELSGRSLSCVVVHISNPLKLEYAKEKNVGNAAELLTAGPMKEKYRADMVEWGERKRLADPSRFCRAAADAVLAMGNRSDVWVVADCRRPSDIDYFETWASGVRIEMRTLRVESTEAARIERGWLFCEGIDDAPTECGLDNPSFSWDFLLENGETLGRISGIVDEVSDVVDEIESIVNTI